MSEKEKLREYEYNKVPTNIDKVIEKPDVPLTYGYGVRHNQLIIYFLCIFVSFIARGHMGVTVVAMTNNIKEDHVTLDQNKIEGNNTNYTNLLSNDTVIEDYNNIIASACNKTIDYIIVNATEKIYKTYDWTKSTQEMILGSFFLGYCIMTLPIGLMTQRLGGKIPLQLALFVNGIVSIMTPWLSDLGGWKVVCACRIAQGLSQAGVYPAIQTLLARWVAISERGTLTSYVYTGSTIGTVVAFQLSGLLSDSRWGWPSTFWAVGMICLALFTLLTVYGAATPLDHKTISEEEKTFILGHADHGKLRRPRTPWKAILTSRPLWGTLAAHTGSGVSFIFFFNQVPSYVHYILGINVRSSGLLSSLPYLASFFTSLLAGNISDYATNNKLVTVRNARRIFNAISQVGLAVSLICATFSASTAVVVTCLVIGMSCHMMAHVGWMVNHIDLAPNFSGTLMTIGNLTTNICSVALPVLVSYVVTNVHNPVQWRIMIFIIAAVSFITNVVFVVLMSADVQPWNDIDQNETSLEDNIKAGDNVDKKEKQIDG